MADNTHIVFIGPIGVGKTTVAQKIAETLNRPYHALDVLRWDYYAEIGYDNDHARHLGETEGFWTMYQYWKPFEIRAVERVLTEKPAGVVDFGAGHSVYEDEVLLARAEQALASYPDVFLLLPSEDVDESMAILNAREDYDIEINRHFMSHPSNKRLATHTLYTANQTPDEICAKVIKLLE